MGYIVIEDFKDLKDGGHMYYAGDHYPAGDKKPSAARIKELSSNKNKRKTPLIRESYRE